MSDEHTTSHEPTTEPSSGETLPVAPERVNILIVDDRPDKSLALEAAITDLDAKIIRASSGKEALRCLLKEDFAVILLDVNMPGMDGFETASLIRQRPRSELTPIIFISAVNDTETHVSRGYELGAVDYILSPIIPEILRAKVAVFVDLFRKTEQIKRQAEERAQLIRMEAARAEAEAARKRSAFLAEASNRLADSLDLTETFGVLAQLAVPELGDGCLIDVLEGDDLRMVACEHRDPETGKLLREYREKFPLSRDTNPITRSLITGETHFCPEFDEKQLVDFALREGEEQALRPVGIQAYLVAPLRAHGRTQGTLCLVSTSERRFRDSDISLIQELARRAALAFENARLYHRAEEARRQAEAANRAKDQFLAMLSHELRTPLTPVLATVSDIEAEQDVPERFREAVEMIRRNVELEARLIDDLLDLTRVSKGKLRLHPQPADVNELIRIALQICQGDLAEKQLEVDLHLEAKKSIVLADSARMQQIFWNLLKNAVKFTPIGGHISIATTNLESGSLRVELRDTGIGISPDVLPRIFNAFEQGEGRQSGGLGLGLAISRALVELHGGTIRAESNGLNCGSAFVIELPTVDGPSTAGGREQPKHAAPQQHGMRILLVEDHADTNRSLQRILQRRGYEVRSAFNVREAVEIGSQYDFDVLISDIGLPDGTGHDVMLALSTQRAFPAIALTGYGMEEDIQQVKQSGFLEHLTKPVEVNRLDDLIRRISPRTNGISHRVSEGEVPQSAERESMF